LGTSSQNQGTASPSCKGRAASTMYLNPEELVTTGKSALAIIETTNIHYTADFSIFLCIAAWLSLYARPTTEFLTKSRKRHGAPP
jgi:hypothetical protein